VSGKKESAAYSSHNFNRICR